MVRQLDQKDSSECEPSGTGGGETTTKAGEDDSTVSFDLNDGATTTTGDETDGTADKDKSSQLDVMNVDESGTVELISRDEAAGEEATLGSEKETTPTSEAISENKNSKEDNEEGVECGFLVDRISTMPYQKAVERGEVPFCAFSPISTQDMYLLRIQECSDKTRHMLVPASKEDVFSTPGALKTMEDDPEPGNEESMNYRVAIVAIARQIYSEEDKQLVVSVDAPLKKDKKKIQVVRFLTLDKFADFAFLGFDGNVSEFANNNNNNNDAAASKENATVSSKDNHNPSQQPIVENKNVMSTPAVPINIKSPPKAPARRGRGGRRRMSRKSPITSSPRKGQLPPSQQASTQFFSTNFQHIPGSAVALPHDLPSDFAQALIKMEQNESEAQQFLAQGYQIPVSQAPDPSIYTQESFVVPADSMPIMQVPAPASEVTISTTEPGADVGAQQTNHDLITIAFDQLVGMSSEVSSSDVPVSEKSSRGGRRAGPGRKPGRKPLKERHPNQIDVIDDTAMSSDDPPAVPKRRGRPPKNRVQVQVSGLESENSNPGLDGELREDFENYEKRMKLQIMDGFC